MINWPWTTCFWVVNTEYAGDLFWIPNVERRRRGKHNENSLTKKIGRLQASEQTIAFLQAK
jgi:hypothetical protein